MINNLAYVFKINIDKINSDKYIFEEILVYKTFIYSDQSTKYSIIYIL